jgi:hypothetical protein
LHYYFKETQLHSYLRIELFQFITTLFMGVVSKWASFHSKLKGWPNP